MAYGIFEQLAELTRKVKSICCSIAKINDSGAGSYKVFSALVTQNGNGNDQQSLYSNPVVVGRSYYIASLGEDSAADFTTIGAPSNTPGTYFIATSNTANWGIIDAELGYNASAPVVKILENTIGNDIHFESGELSRVFTLTSSVGNKFPLDKTATFHQSLVASASQNLISYVSNGSQITFVANTTGILNDFPIEVRIYN